MLKERLKIYEYHFTINRRPHLGIFWVWAENREQAWVRFSKYIKEYLEKHPHVKKVGYKVDFSGTFTLRKKLKVPRKFIRRMATIKRWVTHRL